MGTCFGHRREPRRRDVEASAAAVGPRCARWRWTSPVEAAVRRAVAATERELGPIDVLVNNAAVVDFSPIEHITDERARSVLDTNLLGPAAHDPCRPAHDAVAPERDDRQHQLDRWSDGPVLHGPRRDRQARARGRQRGAGDGGAPVRHPCRRRRAGLRDPDGRRRHRPARDRPQSPYADHERRIVASFAQGKQTAGDPADVGRAGARIEAGNSLRHPVGLDAPIHLDGRRPMTDERWIDLGAEIRRRVLRPRRRPVRPGPAQ